LKKGAVGKVRQPLFSLPVMGEANG